MAVALASAANDTEDVNGSGGDIVLPPPTSVAITDLILAYLWAFGGSGAPTMQAGFTSAGSGGAGPNLSAGWKNASAAESNATFPTPGTEALSLGRTLRLTGHDPLDPIGTAANTGVFGITASAASSTTLPTVTTDVANTRILYLISGSASLPTMGSPTTLHDTGWDLGGGDQFAVYYEDQASAGTSTARTVSYSGTQQIAYAIIPIAPDPGGFPTISGATREGSTSLGSNNSVTVPSGSSGDLVIVIAANDNPSTTNLSFAAGYTAGTQQTQGSNVIKGCVAARVMDGSGSDALTVSGASQDYEIHVIRIPAASHGVTNVATWLAGFTAGNTAASGNVNPPAVSSLASDDYLAITAAITDMTNAADTISADPSGYHPILSNKSASSTSSVGMRTAWSRVTGTSVDPGTFTNTSRASIAFTIAVPPPSSAVAPDAPTEVRPGRADGTDDAFGYSSQVGLEWTAPASDGGSAITGYKIETSTNDGGSWSTHTADTGNDDTDATLTGLTDDTRYLFRVSAINAVGTSDPAVSEWGCTPVAATAPLTPPSATNQGSAGWHLGRIDQRGVASAGTYSYRYTGAGVRIYVVDTGIRATHEQFDNLTFLSGFSVGITDEYADLGHGAVILSVMAGDTIGVAKNPTIVSLKTFDDDHSPTVPYPDEDDLLDCLDWILTNHPGGPAVVNLSLAFSPTSDPTRQATISAKVADLIAAGLVCVQSYGNETGPPDDYTATAQPGLIIVAGSADDDSIAVNSTLGPAADLFAPSEGITHALATSDTAYDVDATGGTSLSAAIVSGVLALWLEANPTLTPRQLQDLARAWSTKDVITGSLLGSPNRLIYTLADIPPAASVEINPTGAVSVSATGTANITATAQISPTGAVSATVTGTANVIPTAQVTPTGAVSATATSTADVTGTAGVTPTGAVSATAAGTANIGGQADIAPTGAVSSSTTGTADVSGQTDVTPVGAVSATTTGIADVGTAASINPTGAVSLTVTGTGDVTATAQIAATGAVSQSATGTGDITATAELAPSGAVSITFTSIANVGAAGTIDPTGAVSLTTTRTADVTGTGNIDPTGAVSATTTGVAQVTATAQITGTGAVSLTATGIADVDVTATINPTGAVSLTYTGTAGIVGTANIFPVGVVSLTFTGTANVGEGEIVYPTVIAPTWREPSHATVWREPSHATTYRERSHAATYRET